MILKKLAGLLAIFKNTYTKQIVIKSVECITYMYYAKSLDWLYEGPLCLKMHKTQKAKQFD